MQCPLLKVLNGKVNVHLTRFEFVWGVTDVGHKERV